VVVNATARGVNQPRLADAVADAAQCWISITHRACAVL